MPNKTKYVRVIICILIYIYMNSKFPQWSFWRLITHLIIKQFSLAKIILIITVIIRSKKLRNYSIIIMVLEGLKRAKQTKKINK